MPFVERDGAIIVGRYAVLQPGRAEEFLGPDDPEILALVLLKVKAFKREEFKEETVARMAAQVSAWNSFDRVDFLLSIANLLDAASMTAAQILAKDIVVWTKNIAIPKVNAMATEGDLLIIDPALADPFGDGTLWPI